MTKSKLAKVKLTDMKRAWMKILKNVWKKDYRKKGILSFNSKF